MDVAIFLAVLVVVWLGSKWATRRYLRPVKARPVQPTLGPPSEPHADGHGDTPSWTEIAAWRGHGITTTEAFTVRSPEWRIAWTTDREAQPGAGVLMVHVYDGVGREQGLVVNQLGPGSGQTTIRTQPDQFQLQITGANLHYYIRVEDQR